MLKAISRLSVDCADFGEAAFLEVKFPFFGRFFAPLFSLAFFGTAFSDSVGLVSLSMNGNRPELWFFVWYTDLGGPLSDAEIEEFVATMNHASCVREIHDDRCP